MLEATPATRVSAVTPDEAVAYVQAATAVSYAVVASAALLVYDYLCTLEREIRYFWSSPSLTFIGRTLFLLNRYMPFVDTFLSLHRQISPMSTDECRTQAWVITWFTVGGFMIAEFVLFVRTYALWAKTTAIRIILSVAAMAALATVIATTLQLRSLHYVALPWPDHPGCNLASAGSIIFVAYLLLMLCETVVVVLTLIKVWPAFRRYRTPVVTKLYHDGILFYCYLLCFSTANVLVPLLAPDSYTNILATPQRVLHSLLCTRVLLVRVAALDPARDSVDLEETHYHCRSASSARESAAHPTLLMPPSAHPVPSSLHYGTPPATPRSVDGLIGLLEKDGFVKPDTSGVFGHLDVYSEPPISSHP